MYFSLITPIAGYERDAASEWLRGPGGAYEQHQWLWRFLPAPSGTPRRFLFRRRDVDGLPRFYVVSPEEPRAPSPHWQVASKRYAPVVNAGDVFDFDLRANPVVTCRNANGKAARHDVVMQAKKLLLRERGLARWTDWTGPDRPAHAELVQQNASAWLVARCDRLGIELIGSDEALRADGYEQHRGKGGALRLSSVDFSGRLKVVRPEVLREALYSGVGHGKAFGCGLLMLRRARA